jgi:lipopolysaccharide biosynthesis glycosyltransferase
MGEIELISKQPLFIGCACDHAFAEPTATMLTSLDINGEVPEATIIVAGFELADEDRIALRAGAGNRRVIFADITAETLYESSRGRYTEEYPLPVLGRLFVADHVDRRGSRLVTLDSDMIVNASLRPLVDRDLGSEYFAAIHDTPRVNDLTYFNSGLTMFDVDTYKFYDIGRRCLQWLENLDHHPHFPDQDALNAIVGHSWHRLARTWNYFCCDDAGFTPEDLETCKVAHFAGPKPWNNPNHTAAKLYRRYSNELYRRLERAAGNVYQ